MGLIYGNLFLEHDKSVSMKKIKIFGRNFNLNITYDCYSGEEILDSQQAELKKLNTSAIDSALENVKDYVIKTANDKDINSIENIFKYIMPKTIYVPRNEKDPSVAIMCNYKFNIEHGIAIVFKNGKFKEVVSQDAVL